MEFLDDSAWPLLEKLNNHVILTKNLNIRPKIKKLFKQSRKIFKNPGFPRDPCGDPCGDPVNYLDRLINCFPGGNLYATDPLGIMPY